MRFETYPAGTTKKSWGWRLVEENNRVIADTGGYDTQANVHRAIHDLKNKSAELAVATVVVRETSTRPFRRLAPRTQVRRQGLAEAMLLVAESGIKVDRG